MRVKIKIMTTIISTYKENATMICNLKSHNTQLANPSFDRGFLTVLVHEYRQME
jgi:hypothetical protein